MPFAVCFLLALLCCGPARAFEAVSIPRAGGDLHAVLFRPAGPGPFPAVVALHGCAGLGDPANPVESLYRDWGERLAASGYAALFPDSFGSREAGPQCGVRPPVIRPRFERVDDAETARHWLEEQSWIKPQRISIMGWSQGGSTALFAVQVRPRFRPSSGDFRSAVAFYPACRRAVERAWSARVPTLVMVGTADDWTPAEACKNMVLEARGRSARAEVVAYPGAYHAFDHPHLSPQVRNEPDAEAASSGRAHVGTNPAARADAIRRVMDWLAR